MPELIEISGPLRSGMWHYEVLYPPVRIEELPPLDWPEGSGKVYGQSVQFGAQAGTHIATGRHLFADAPDIASIPVDRCRCPASIVQVQAGAGSRITLDQVTTALEGHEVQPREGEALLIATGWDRYWDDDRFLSGSPRLAYDLVEWAVDLGLAFLGSDIALYDADWDENFWPMLYRSTTLPLAPLVNLTEVGVPRAQLTALPLRIEGACGSPCRAFLELDD